MFIYVYVSQVLLKDTGNPNKHHSVENQDSLEAHADNIDKSHHKGLSSGQSDYSDASLKGIINPNVSNGMKGQQTDLLEHNIVSAVEERRANKWANDGKQCEVHFYLDKYMFIHLLSIYFDVLQ